MHLCLQAEVEVDIDEDGEDEILGKDVGQVLQDVICQGPLVVESLSVKSPDKRSCEYGIDKKDAKH